MTKDGGAGRVVLLSGAFEPAGEAIARAVLDEGGRVAAAVPRSWQVDKLRERIASDDLLVGHVGPTDGEAAAGFVKGATDALGDITEFYAGSCVFRAREAGKDPTGDLQELLDVNLHTNVTLARAVLPRMRRRGAGELQFLDVSIDPNELSATCRASLAALREFATAIAADVDGTAIEVIVNGAAVTTS